jgi:hypothetical protein
MCAHPHVVVQEFMFDPVGVPMDAELLSFAIKQRQVRLLLPIIIASMPYPPYPPRVSIQDPPLSPLCAFHLTCLSDSGLSKGFALLTTMMYICVYTCSSGSGLSKGFAL